MCVDAAVVASVPLGGNCKCRSLSLVVECARPGFILMEVFPSHPMPPRLSMPMLQVVRNEVKEAVRWEGGDDSYQPQLFANVKLRKYWAASAAADTVTGTQAAK